MVAVVVLGVLLCTVCGLAAASVGTMLERERRAEWDAAQRPRRS